MQPLDRIQHRNVSVSESIQNLYLLFVRGKSLPRGKHPMPLGHVVLLGPSIPLLLLEPYMHIPDAKWMDGWGTLVLIHGVPRGL